MINKIILNIATLSSILLLSACSNSHKQIKPELTAKNVSIYNIMGITQANNTHLPVPQYQQIAPEKTYLLKNMISVLNKLQTVWFTPILGF